MVTMVLDVFRQELVKACCGKSEYFKRSIIVEGPLLGTIRIAEGSTTITSPFDDTNFELDFATSADKNTVFVENDEGAMIGRIVTGVNVSDPQNMEMYINEPFPDDLAGDYSDYYTGHYDYTMILRKVSFGDGGFDNDLDIPKPVTGEETDLFGVEEYGRSPVAVLDVDDGYPKWLGIQENLDEYNNITQSNEENLQVNSCLIKITMNPSELGITTQEIDELGVIADFYNEDSGNYDQIMIGLMTRYPIRLDSMDNLEFYLKLNF
jgi:hypothetical protein